MAVPGSCNLVPGLYVFSDSDFSVAGGLEGNDVTLVFEGTSSFDVSGALQLAATSTSSTPVADELPGVAIFFDSGDTATFYLGPAFAIVGNVYGLDATWGTKANDCATYGVCRVSDGSISVAHTSFAGGIVPRVGPSPTPAAAHLSE